MKKSVLGLCVLAAVGLASQGVALAKDYPTKPIELIVPVGPGGSTDLSARVFAKHAQKKFGKPVVIVNIKGAGGYTGSKAVYDSAPDGYKVLYTHAGIVTNHVTNTAPYSYDGFKVGPTVIEDPSLALFVNGKSGMKTLGDLIAKAKAEPGKLKTATEYGAFTYFMLLKLQKEQGVKFNLVDVGGDADKTVALLGGHVDVMPKVYLGTEDYLDSGDFVVLGVAQAERAANAPKVPTFKETGIDFQYHEYPFTIFFQKDTPQEVIDAWLKVAQEVTADPAYKKDVEKLGMVPVYKSPEEAAKNFAAMQAEFAELAKEKAEVAAQK